MRRGRASEHGLWSCPPLSRPLTAAPSGPSHRSPILATLFLSLPTFRSWTKISDHYISGVYPVTNWVSFGIGQLGRRQRNDSEPTALLK